MTFRIKNMVCDRCIETVRNIFDANGFNVSVIKLGEVITDSDASLSKISSIRKNLYKNGFELIEDKNLILVNRIKTHIIELVRNEELLQSTNKISAYLSSKLNKDHNILSSLFSSSESVTIEKYFILQKIEYVKELLEYNELTLSEISYKLGYSSVAHLSGQFKQVTGMTTSDFKKLPGRTRKTLDRV